VLTSILGSLSSPVKASAASVSEFGDKFNCQEDESSHSGLPIVDGCEDKFDQVSDNAKREMVLNQAFAHGGTIDQPPRWTPILRQPAASGQLVSGKM